MEEEVIPLTGKGSGANLVLIGVVFSSCFYLVNEAEHRRVSRAHRKPCRVNMGSPLIIPTDRKLCFPRQSQGRTICRGKPRTLAPKQAKHSVTNIQQAWWPTFVMSSLQRLWQDWEFWTSLSNKQTNQQSKTKQQESRGPGKRVTFRESSRNK